MKIIHLSNSDSGGAGRAAYRIHKSLIEIGLNSEMWVNLSKTNDSTVKSPAGVIKKSLVFVRRNTKRLLTTFFKTKNSILHSPALFSSSWVNKINNSAADIVHLHWFQHEMLSIKDISRIKKPIVWTLHDMWAFCGAEHISWDKRWKNGYYSFNRPSHEKGFDLNKWTWERKKKYWKKTYQIITPSNWLSKCVKQSKLMFKWPVTTIGNPIDTHFWKPENKKKCRDFFKFSHKDKILLFGTFGSNLEYHKGFDILKKTLRKINNKNLKLVIFGENKKIKFSELDTQVIDIGFIKKNEELKYLYSAADATIIPSRIESFGQMASESSACGTPVIAFRTGGLKDIVEHKITGYLAKNFESEDLANGINWILSSKNKKKISQNARKRIINNFDNYKIAKKYLKVYCKNIVPKIDL
jgi:glycosyltransferase involved in cell wall biosynthesis